MTTAAWRLYKKLGRRGIALVILGLGQVCLGLGYVLDPGPRPIGLGLLDRHGGIQVWAFLWITCGGITFGSGWLRVGRDWFGFLSAVIPPLMWGSAFFWGALSGDHPRGLALAAWYGVGHVCFILWAASVPEYQLPHMDPDKERR